VSRPHGSASLGLADFDLSVEAKTPAVKSSEEIMEILAATWPVGSVTRRSWPL
jgi:hypothetical protein